MSARRKARTIILVGLRIDRSRVGCKQSPIFPKRAHNATLRYDEYIALSDELALDRFPSGPIARVF